MSGGLLGMMSGFDDPKTMGLLGMAAPLLQAGGWSDKPVSLGQALGAGMQGGVSAYAQGRQAQQLAALRDLQAQQTRMGIAQTEMQMQTGLEQLNMRRAAAGLAPLSMEQFTTQASGSSGPTGTTSAMAAPENAGQAPQAQPGTLTAPQLPSRPISMSKSPDDMTSAELMSDANWYAAAGDAESAKAFRSAAFLKRDTLTKGMKQTDANGNVINMPGVVNANAEQEGANTTARQSAELPFVGPRARAEAQARTAVELGAAEPLAAARARGAFYANPQILNPNQTMVQFSPTGPAQVIATAPSAPPANYQRTGDGSRIEPIPGGPDDSTQKNARTAKNALPIIDEAEKVLKDATGSGIGALADWAAGLVGMSTAGAEGTDKLKVLEGALMMNMPRMEGPQSDKDVAMYKQAAASIADPMIPKARRQAALSQLRALLEKYQEAGSGSAQPTTGSTIDPLGIR